MGLVVGIFVFARLIPNIAQRMIYPFLPVFSRGLGVGLESISLALTARSLTGVLNPLVAPFADRYGRKAGMLLGMGIFSAAMFLPVLLPNFAGFTVALSISMLGVFIFIPSVQAYIGDQVAYGKRGGMLAITELGWSISFIVFVPLMGLLLAAAGWLAPFPVLGAAGWLAFLLLVLFVPADRPVGRTSSATGVYRAIFTSRAALAVLGMCFCLTAANEVVNVVFGVWMEASFGLQVAALGLASAVIGFAELGGEAGTVALVDRIGKENAVRYGLIASIIASLLLPVLGTNLIGGLAGLFLFYIANEFCIVSCLPLVSQVLPGARATLLGVNVAAFSLGRGLGALLAPHLYTFGLIGNVVAAVVFNLLAIWMLTRVQVAEEHTDLPPDDQHV